MALKVHYNFKQGGVTLQSGNLYKFSYQAFEHDPSPVILYLNSLSGRHPTTGRQWRFHQAINLNYLPRGTRAKFVETWMAEMLRNKGNVKLTWDRVKTQYPYMKEVIRRYFYSPVYYIRGLEYIPPDKAQEEVVRSYFKDFNMLTQRRVAAHFRTNQMKGIKRK
ncbi:MAG: hypothetical protein WC503_00700 [Candidatus Shapirobacteria bacterium]